MIPQFDLSHPRTLIQFNADLWYFVEPTFPPGFFFCVSRDEPIACGYPNKGLWFLTDTLGGPPLEFLTTNVVGLCEAYGVQQFFPFGYQYVPNPFP